MDVVASNLEPSLRRRHKFVNYVSTNFLFVVSSHKGLQVKLPATPCFATQLRRPAITTGAMIVCWIWLRVELFNHTVINQDLEASGSAMPLD